MNNAGPSGQRLIVIAERPTRCPSPADRSDVVLPLAAFYAGAPFQELKAARPRRAGVAAAATLPGGRQTPQGPAQGRDRRRKRSSRSSASPTSGTSTARHGALLSRDPRAPSKARADGPMLIHATPTKGKGYARTPPRPRSCDREVRHPHGLSSKKATLERTELTPSLRANPDQRRRNWKPQDRGRGTRRNRRWNRPRHLRRPGSPRALRRRQSPSRTAVTFCAANGEGGLKPFAAIYSTFCSAGLTRWCMTWRSSACRCVSRHRPGGAGGATDGADANAGQLRTSPISQPAGIRRHGGIRWSAS